MIRFDQVTKTYAGTTRPALNSVSLEVLKGEFVFLVGASGSGKSSFLRLVLKEEKPSKGRIHVLGQELNTLASRKVPYFRRNLGVVFQDFRLLPNKTVFDNVAFSLQVIGKSKGFIQEAVPDVLKMVGLAGKQGRYPHELSGGEQQRVAIARAVVNKPAILLADEPTGNLDPSTSAGIMTLLSAINANGTTVLMATHDVGIVDQMQRRVIELVSGQIVRDERGGGYQTQANPVIRQNPAAARAAAGANPDSAIDDAALAPGLPATMASGTGPATGAASPAFPAFPASPASKAAPAAGGKQHAAQTTAEPASSADSRSSVDSRSSANSGSSENSRPTPTQAPVPSAQPAPQVPQPTSAPSPVEPPVTTGTITVVEPEVTSVRTTPPAPPKSAPHVVPRTDDLPASAEPTPLVPPPLNEPRRR